MKQVGSALILVFWFNSIAEKEANLADSIKEKKKREWEMRDKTK